ncbi:hypothetical protein N7468_001078 [Penicillium chermesinum]|uniref:Uncharacterized protein n=1 Tax=Penicillium chermesinum TaxID=63820 RepID=A0A9W9PG34_9EURO|nr:uncharacterized protein N7468_001078 [Penicillium chermesinum]KAJ5246095.1 hypothetical protein N7468_001078 [Penicillium chermesinum]
MRGLSPRSFFASPQLVTHAVSCRYWPLDALMPSVSHASLPLASHAFGCHPSSTDPSEATSRQLNFLSPRGSPKPLVKPPRSAISTKLLGKTITQSAFHHLHSPPSSFSLCNHTTRLWHRYGKRLYFHHSYISLCWKQ